MKIKIDFKAISGDILNCKVFLLYKINHKQQATKTEKTDRQQQPNRYRTNVLQKQGNKCSVYYTKQMFVYYTEKVSGCRILYGNQRETEQMFCTD